MTFTDRLAYEIPPLVRGLTFDGQKGLFVHAVTGKKVDLMLNPVSESMEETVVQWKRLLDAYTEERRVYPAVIGIGETDFTYGLGTNYDEAVRAEGVSALPVLPPSDSRSDVVRDKIVLVTGGAQGFGEGMVRSLVEQGSFVYIADMNEQGAKKLADELNYEACITVAKSLAVNVTDETSVEAMMDQVALETGSLDVFVSNAGVLRAGSVKAMS
ncbi:MAG: SDR family NAD(P)-dependent oxidoreductase, partial [Spirochaetia bacterium]|nr:SDR family NAD(P)-dependent oxidoreductase [Spirochaetia bacterium]